MKVELMCDVVGCGSRHPFEGGSVEHPITGAWPKAWVIVQFYVPGPHGPTKKTGAICWKHALPDLMISNATYKHEGEHVPASVDLPGRQEAALETRIGGVYLHPKSGREYCVRAVVIDSGNTSPTKGKKLVVYEHAGAVFVRPETEFHEVTVAGRPRFEFMRRGSTEC